MLQPHKSAESYFDAGNELFLGSRDFPAAVDYLQKYLASGALVEGAPAFRAHYLMGQLHEKMGQNGAAAARLSSLAGTGVWLCTRQKALSRVQ